jgi:uncharacterized protein (TIGR02246 family)
MPVDLEAAKAVERISESLVDAWNRHDAHSFASNFAQDADFTNVFGMHAKGREAIEGFHRPIFETIFKDSRLTLDETRMRVIRPDVIAVDMRWAMTGARNPLGAEWPRRTGLINILVTREENAWSIAVMHNMDLPDPNLVEAQKALQEQKQK